MVDECYLDGGEGEGDLALAVDVGVQHAVDVLEGPRHQQAARRRHASGLSLAVRSRRSERERVKSQKRKITTMQIKRKTMQIKIKRSKDKN